MHMHKTNTMLFLLALSTLAVVHIVSLKLYLYWYYLWLDVPVHFLGGICVSLGLFSFAELHVPGAQWATRSLWRALCFVVLVMIAWEVFEVWAGVPMQANYLGDTTLDLIMGFLGGLTGYGIAKRMQHI